MEMATRKKRNPKPPYVAKAGIKHGARYGCGGKLKKK